MNALYFSLSMYLSPLIFPINRFIQNQQAQAGAGVAEGLDWLSTFLSLMEKFGVMAVFVAVFGWILYGFIRAMKRAELVPREIYEQVVAERDEAQKQLAEQIIINNKQAEMMNEQNKTMNKRTDEVLIPLTVYLSKLKPENSSNLDEGRLEGSGN